MPPLRLTPALVRTLGTPGVRSEHRDEVVTGLALRVSARGGRKYVLNYSIAGRSKRYTLGAPSERFTLADARAQAKDLLEQIRRGTDPGRQRRTERRRAGLTVGDLVASRLAAAKLRPSTERHWRQLLAAEIIPTWGHRPAAELTRGEVREGLEGIARRSGWTANHALELLRWAFARGLEMDLVGATPCAGVRKPHQGEASQRVLSTLEVRALWRALELMGTGQLADVARMLLLTGVRREMVLGARAGEFEGVDDSAHSDRARPASAFHVSEIATSTATYQRWTIPGGFAGRSKSGRPHVVPLSPQALTVVRRRLEYAKDGFLFPTWHVRRDGRPPRPYMSWSSSWVSTLKRATAWTLWGLTAADDAVGPALAPMERWKLHGLRHTIATHMREDLRVDRNVVALILGHSQTGGGGSTHVYDRAELLGERRAALTSWGAWVESVAKGERATVLPMRG